MRLKLKSWLEHVRASLFLVPMIAVVLGIALAWAGIRVDHHLDQTNSTFPLSFTSTVESARALLGTIAGATITFASIAFSVSLLIIQQAASQYSPRIVYTMYRDPFTKRVMGLVVGTFTYCLLVLRSVRSPLEKGGEANIPNLSVAIAVVLGIGTILAIVAFIDHSAHSMDISNILHAVEQRTTEQIEKEWPLVDSTVTARSDRQSPEPDGHTVRFDQSGWVQLLDVDKLTDCLEPNMTMWVDTYPGRYAVRGTPICVLSAVPDDVEATERNIRASLSTGDTRTMQQDVTYGLRQLTDVALKALSPGINDPTTAQDAIFHSASVVAALLQRDPPASLSGNDRVVMAQQPTHDDLINLAFDEVRQAASALPVVCVYLLESLALLVEACPESTPDRHEALLRQAQLVVAGCAAADNLPDDIHQVELAHTKRFGFTSQ